MAKMTPEKAIKLFQKYYEEALRSEYVQKKVSWALYQAWKEADAKEARNR